MKKIKTVAQLGDIVRKRRKQQGLTQAELAGVSGVGRRFVSELESGKESCQISKVLQVLRTLGVEVDVYGRGES